MKLTDFIKSLAKKVGIPETDPNIVAIVGNASLADVDIAPETVNTINANLYTADAAINNPEIRKEIIPAGIAIGRAEVFNGLDLTVTQTMDELGLDDAARAEILAEKSTPQRAALLAKKAREIGSAGKEGNANTKELVKQVNDLNSAISKIKRDHELEIKAKDAEVSERMLQKDIDTDLTGFNYIFPKETSLNTKLAAARASINTKLAAKGLKVVSDSAGNKKIIRADGTEYFDEQNKPVSYHDFVSGALAQDNLLMVTDPTTLRDEDKTKPPHVSGNQNGNVNHSFIGQVDADMQNLENALKLNPISNS